MLFSEWGVRECGTERSAVNAQSGQDNRQLRTDTKSELQPSFTFLNTNALIMSQLFRSLSRW